MKLPFLSSQEVIKTLRKAGFDYAPKRGKGSHTALFKIDEQGRKLLVIIPRRKDMPKGVLLSILQQANLSKDEFVELLM
ncbi:MAG: type II toxin-antitoxin system HicA family toxin [Methanothrix sp.]